MPGHSRAARLLGDLIDRYERRVQADRFEIS